MYLCVNVCMDGLTDYIHMRELLVGRKNFLIHKLKTLVPFGLRELANKKDIEAAAFLHNFS